MGTSGVIQINIRGQGGHTALHHAALRDGASFAALLMEKNADTEVYNYVDMKTPLHFAAQSANEETVKLLIQNGAKINAIDA